MDEIESEGKPPRKRSPRETKSGKRRPATSEANRRRYQNPIYLAQSQAAMRKIKSPGRPVGSFDGARKNERIRITNEAREQAKRTIVTMKAKGVLVPEEDMRAVEALENALTVMRTPVNQPVRLAAAKLILEYTKAKPAAKSEVTINKAEEWLAAIADDDGDESPTESDA